MIPYGRQSIDEHDIAAVVATLKSRFLTQGPKVGEFERALAKVCGARFAVAVSSGTAALHVAYLAAGLKPGDEVITSPNTFVATTNMLLAIGVQPVFCDLRLDTYNLDEKKIEPLITKKTKAIVAVDFAGHPAELHRIKRIARRHKLIFIEDAAQGLGARFRGKKVGGIADLAIFSFHPVKTITTGEGGAITTSNKKLYEKMLLLRTHGTAKNKEGKNIMTELGYNYRLTDIQASLGVSQLRKLSLFLSKRHEVVRWYQKELKSVPDVKLPVELKHVYSSWHLYVIRLKDRKTRDELAKHLSSRGIGINFHYPAVYAHPYYRRHGFRHVNLTNMKKYEDTALTIPLHTTFTRKDVSFIARETKTFLQLKK